MGMSIHPIESFDETEAISILKSFLESKHTIKTFFGENDRTPNHDGFFELVDHTLAPRKQFIVQIKKTKRITPNVIGTNKGKYVYDLKTNFLEYVKKKVTESPAIYFVVDIEDNRIFWLYLSDEVLMSMNFEGREKVSFAFSEENILSDISAFTIILNQIVAKRNKPFLNKSKEEITAMQDAVDYLNQYLDHDLKVIKDNVFPNLWRFGIKCSDNPGISIGIGQGMKMVDCSSAVALYPQIKGTNDSGIQEYMMCNDNLFNHITFGSQIDLSKYSKDALHKIVILFFEKGIPAKYLPDTVLFEIINVFINKSSCFFDESNLSEFSVSEVDRRFMLLGKYVQHILSSSSINDEEIFIKQSIFNRISRGQRSFFDITSHKELIKSFSNYHKTVNEKAIIAPELFLYISKDYFVYLDVLIELQNRNVEIIEQIWNYKWFYVCQMSKKNQFDILVELMKRWFSQLVLLYNETYAKMFRCNDYRIKNKYLLKVKKETISSTCISIEYIYQKYKDSVLSLFYDPDFVEEASFDVLANNNYISTTYGIDFGSIFKDHTPFLYGLSCLLYNGLCATLEFKPQKLNILKKSLSGGLKFF